MNTPKLKGCLWLFKNEKGQMMEFNLSLEKESLALLAQYLEHKNKYRYNGLIQGKLHIELYPPALAYGFKVLKEIKKRSLSCLSSNQLKSFNTLRLSSISLISKADGGDADIALGENSDMLITCSTDMFEELFSSLYDYSKGEWGFSFFLQEGENLFMIPRLYFSRVEPSKEDFEHFIDC